MDQATIETHQATAQSHKTPNKQERSHKEDAKPHGLHKHRSESNNQLTRATKATSLPPHIQQFELCAHTPKTIINSE